MSHIEITEKAECCGCAACANICPSGCITMVVDTEGFAYPAVDTAHCTDCGLCEKACPMQTKQMRSDRLADPLCLAAWTKDAAARKDSSSGGIFSVLAEHCLAEGGVVFGAAFDERLSLRHMSVADRDSLRSLRGSKYLQSEICEAYTQAGESVREGRNVLFTGTPCQVSGLHAYLGKEHSNLLTCDLVCHGVPSPAVFRSYINRLEDTHGQAIVSYEFRNKRKGWKEFSVSAKFDRGAAYTKTLHEDPFVFGFLENIYLRPSCHQCKIRRQGDITLGDFWGISAQRPDLDDDKGTSLVLINTEKGRRAFDQCSKSCFSSECDFERACIANPPLLRPWAASSRREQFFADYTSKPFDYVMKEHMSPPSPLLRQLSRIKRKAASIIRRKS